MIKEYYPWFLDTYNSYPYNIQRADAIRPFILYHYGGLYVDMDTFCLTNFDNVFQKKGVYLLESASFRFTNSMMASSNLFQSYNLIPLSMASSASVLHAKNISGINK